MNTAWFTETVAWLPGTLLGVTCGVFGSFAGCVLSSKEKSEKWRAVVTQVYWTLITCSAVLLVLGCVALVVHQPYGVWYALLLPGVIGIVSLGSCGFVLKPPSPRSSSRNFK